MQFVKQTWSAITLLVLLTLITGVIYPLVVTGIAITIFPHQAGGSLIVKDGQVQGSELLGQSFDDPKYFWGRLSATGPFPYNAGVSSGSNLGPLNPALRTAVESRVQALQKHDPELTKIPVDLVTASGSGLDPHISPAAASVQAARVARARNVSLAEIKKLVVKNTAPRQFGLLGEPSVNVLLLNRDLDALNRTQITE